MRVGELARRTGTTVRALRYYESVGLVVPRRLSNGYREYDLIAERQVAQIRELMALGLSVEETRPFVESIANGTGDVCAAAVATFRSTVVSLQKRIGELTARRDATHWTPASTRRRAPWPRVPPRPPRTPATWSASRCRG